MGPRIYLYKIIFENQPFWYWGVHKESKFGERYMGSPITNKRYWETFKPLKEIVETFNYSEEGWLKALERESRLIREDWLNPLCLNATCGGKPSPLLMKKLWKDPDFREKQSRIRKSLWKDDSYREKVSSGVSRAWEYEGRKERHVKNMVERYENPDYKNNLVKKLSIVIPLACEASQSPEAKRKRKETLEKIGHQRGEKNSQYGTMWITNGKINRKIKKGDAIPSDFYPGRILSQKKD